MQIKKILCYILSVSLVLALALPVRAAILVYETQYEYDSSDIAWLSDLTVKTGLDSVGSLAESLTLIPVSDYPYRETAESFGNDVNNFANIYLLNENSPRAAYVYFFEMLSSFSGTVAGELSDSEIASWLNSQGVSYSYNGDSDMAIVARALYTALATGTVSVATGGQSIEALAIDFIENISGADGEAVSGFLPDKDSADLDEYLLAASKAVLWSAGYDVDADTDEGTVYKLIACMTIESNGITADTDTDFDTLKLKFLSAMLAKKYGVTPDTATLGDALEADRLDVYMLRLIGMKHGLSVGDRALGDAFAFVAENTDEFDLEAGEFYADIMTYGAVIPRGTEYIWINPVPVCEDGTVVITSNGTQLKNSYYTKIAIDPEKETQTVPITVNASLGTKKSEKTYNLKLYSGDNAPVNPNSTGVSDAVNKLFYSSETLLAGVLSGLSLDMSVSLVLDKAVSEADVKVRDVMAVIAPTFEDGSAPTEIAGQDECIAFLDKIGGMFDSEISGIEGIDVLKSVVSDMAQSGVTFDFFG